MTMPYLRNLRSLDRSAKVEVIITAREHLERLGIADPWSEASAYLRRADELEQAADAVTRPTKPPLDAVLVDRLAAGSLDPDELPELLAAGPAADSAERVQRFCRSAADRCRMAAVESVRRTGDALVTEHLRPAAQRALSRSDALLWCRLCDVADDLRSVGLLPARLSAVDRRFDALEYRFGRPERLPSGVTDLGPDDLLATARECDAQPGVYSDQETYERSFPPKPARPAVVR